MHALFGYGMCCKYGQISNLDFTNFLTEATLVDVDGSILVEMTLQYIDINCQSDCGNICSFIHICTTISSVISKCHNILYLELIYNVTFCSYVPGRGRGVFGKKKLVIIITIIIISAFV